MRAERLETLKRNIPKTDAEAHYAKVVSLDLATVRPFVSGPNHVKVTIGKRAEYVIAPRGQGEAIFFGQ